VSAAPGGYDNTPCVGDQTSEARGVLDHTTVDQIGPDRVPERRILILDSARSQRESHGVEFWADHNQGLALA
jgi:hypothetical protein